MSSKRPERNYLIFLISILLFAIGASMFRGILDNHLAGNLAVSRAGRGVVEFFREMPGLLLFLIIALFYRMPEHHILRIGFFIALLGMTGFLLFGSTLIPAVALLTLFSAGQHILMPVRQSFAVHSAPPGGEGAALGLMRSIESIGQVAGFLLVPLIFATVVVRSGYIVTMAGVVVLIAAALATSFLIKRDSVGHVKRQRLYFRRKFMTYYILQNFYGARKQVFLTFGPYVLILKYGATPTVIASLLGLCAVLNIIGSPIIGRIIDTAGYKAVMVGDTVLLFFICLLYGFAHRLFPFDIAYIVTCGVFVADSLISHASMAASVYVKHLSDSREEMTATLTTGISLDHLISIFIAMAGGMIWEFLGIEVLFILAALMALMNSLIALTIKTPDDRVTG